MKDFGGDPWGFRERKGRGEREKGGEMTEKGEASWY